MNRPYTDRERQFEEYLRDGVTAAKSGQRRLAESLLNRAIYLNSADARPYIWLSATTDDPKEQFEYLEKAVALEPGNASARRGLALLSGKLDRSRVLPEGTGVDLAPSPQEVEATGQAFTCPKCGGRMAFSLQKEGLSCEYCGYVELAVVKPGYRAEANEQVMDYYLHTERGHRWAVAQQQLKCERCGALNLLSPGERQAECAYCGSNQMIQSPEQAELIDPQAIGIMVIDAVQAEKIVRRWLGSGLFSPDTLAESGGSLRLRPAYYSCWTFDGALEVRWTCEVADEGGGSKHWTQTSGVETRFFNDLLVSGVAALPTRQLDRLEPFNLSDLKEFNPDYLAGWPAILYDLSLSDGSLTGRQKAMSQLRADITNLAAAGREKRNVNIGTGSWSGMTFKHILLPLWIGSYRFNGVDYRLLINGQTGKVSGERPRDKFKAVMAGAIIFLLLFLAILIYWILTHGGI